MERCETCEYWVIQYEEKEWFAFTDREKDYDGIALQKTEYGECKEAISIYGRITTLSLSEIRKEKPPMLTLDAEEYGGARLYTHKDHCCKCWKGKES